MAAILESHKPEINLKARLPLRTRNAENRGNEVDGGIGDAGACWSGA